MRAAGRGWGWVAAAGSVLLVPLYFAAGDFGHTSSLSFWVGFAIFTGVIAVAIWASVVAARRLSRWWYFGVGVWALVFLIYTFAVLAFAAM